MNSNNQKTLVGLLNNIGENSCFLNSILQLILHIKPFRSYITKTFPSSHNLLFQKISSLFHEYSQKENEAPKKDPDSLSTTEIRYQLQKLSNNLFQMNYCCDPVEFLDFLLNHITKYTLGRHLLSKLFLIQSETIHSCKNNHVQNVIIDNFFYPIYIKQIIEDKNSLLNNDYAVDKLFIIDKNIQQTINKKCDKCKQVMKRKFLCKKIPMYFMVSFVWDRERPLLANVHHLLKMIPFDVNLQTDVFDNESNRINNNQLSMHYLYALLLFSYKEQHYVIMIKNGDYWTFYNDKQVYNDKFLRLLEALLSYEFYPVLVVYKEEAQKTMLKSMISEGKLKELNDINSDVNPIQFSNSQILNNNAHFKQQYVPNGNIVKDDFVEGNTPDFTKEVNVQQGNNVMMDINNYDYSSGDDKRNNNYGNNYGNNQENNQNNNYNHYSSQDFSLF